MPAEFRVTNGSAVSANDVPLTWQNSNVFSMLRTVVTIRNGYARDGPHYGVTRDDWSAQQLSHENARY